LALICSFWIKKVKKTTSDIVSVVTTVFIYANKVALLVLTGKQTKETEFGNKKN